jgi:hypothetical protein
VRRRRSDRPHRARVGAAPQHAHALLREPRLQAGRAHRKAGTTQVRLGRTHVERRLSGVVAGFLHLVGAVGTRRVGGRDGRIEVGLGLWNRVAGLADVGLGGGDLGRRGVGDTSAAFRRAIRSTSAAAFSAVRLAATSAAAAA